MLIFFSCNNALFLWPLLSPIRLVIFLFLYHFLASFSLDLFFIFIEFFSDYHFLYLLFSLDVQKIFFPKVLNSFHGSTNSLRTSSFVFQTVRCVMLHLSPESHLSVACSVSFIFFCFLCKRILEIFVYLSVGFCIQQFSIVHIFFLPNKEHIQHLFNILSYCSHFDISLANLALVF